MTTARDLVKRIPGATRLAHLVRLAGTNYPRAPVLKLIPRNGICAEIGVHQGDFSAVVLNTARPKELHLIDPWRHEESAAYEQAWYGGQAKGGQTEMDSRYGAVCARFAADIQSGRVTIHRASSREALDRFPDAHFDWIYIDGNHLYEFVKQDLELSFHKTKSGGYIAGDDYTEGGWWQGGVKQAVDEFVREKPVRLVTIRNRQFVLQK